MKKIFLLVFMIIFLAPLSLAQDGYLGARPIGMGGAFTGLADDTNAVFVNPAGIGQLRGQWASFSTEGVKGENHATFSGFAHTEFGSFGAGIYIADFPIGYSADLRGDTIVKIFKKVFILSYSREFNEFMVVPESLGRLSFGASVKGTYSRIVTATGLTDDLEPTYSTDFGLLFKPNKFIALGVTLYNAGKALGEDSGTGVSAAESEPWAAVGVSGKLLNETLTWSWDEGRFGVEWDAFPSIALRAGQMERNVTFGVGITSDIFNIDYAYEIQDNPVHYVTFSVAVDKLGMF
jgi:hypothetical protein